MRPTEPLTPSTATLKRPQPDGPHPLQAPTTARRSRFLPACGVASVVLLAASLAVAGTAPAADAAPTDVVAFYTHHGGMQQASGVLMSLGALLFLAFSVGLATAGRRRIEWSWPAALTVAGGAVVTTGLTVFAALALATGAVAAHIEPSALQALHVLNQDLFTPLTVGTSAFLFGAGWLTMDRRDVPRWLSVLAIAFGVVAAIPSHVLGGPLYHVGFFGFAGMGLWTVVVSLVLAGVRHAR